MFSWLPHLFFAVTGAKNEPGWVYGFWSGFAGGLQLFEWIGVGVLLYWHRACHVRRCLRPGRHPVGGTGVVTCRKHHPVLGGRRHLTAERVLHLHREAQQQGTRQ